MLHFCKIFNSIIEMFNNNTLLVLIGQLTKVCLKTKTKMSVYKDQLVEMVIDIKYKDDF